MLDRKVIKEVIENHLREWDIELKPNIEIKDLNEAFCLFVEDDYYQWIKDNLDSFFEMGNNGIDWNSIEKKIEKQIKFNNI